MGSLASEKQLPLLAGLLGIVAILGSIFIGMSVVNVAKKQVQDQIEAFLLQKAESMTSFSIPEQKLSDSTLLEQIQTAWQEDLAHPPDAYICIVDSEAKLILHSAAPHTVGNDAGANQLTSTEGQYISNLGALARSGNQYVGGYISSAGEEQIAAFSPIRNRGWTLGLHRSKELVEDNIADDLKVQYWGVIAISLGIIPLAMGLLYVSFVRINNKNRIMVGQINRDRLLLEQTGKIAQVGGWEVNLKTMQTYFTDHTYAIYDLPFTTPPSVEEGINYYAPEYQGIITGAVENAINSNQSYDIECELISAKGIRKWVRTQGHVVHEAGTPVRLYGAIQDVSLQKQNELRIEENAALLKSIYNAIPDAIVATDINRKIVSVNKGFERIFGYSEAEIQGELTSYFYESEEEFTEQGKTRYNLSAAEKLEPYVVSYKTKSGVIFPGETLGVPITNSHQETIGFLGVMRDIRSRIQLENALQQAQKLEAIGTMVGGIAHELNNILQSIFLYGGLVQRVLPMDKRIHSNFKYIMDGAIKAKEIVKQILTFSRRAKFDMKPQHIHELIEDVLQLERVSFPENIQIQADIDTDCDPIICDTTQINQILLNLCNNALHAMEGTGGILTVSLKQIEGSNENEGSNDFLELKVTDTGSGIAPEELERIFDPFFTTKELGKGTGLGMSVVHGIIESMNGTIDVSSEVEVGTTITIQVPVTPHTEAEPIHIAPLKVHDINTRSKRILFIDDNDSVRDPAREVLQEDGFLVDSTDDGQKALDIFLLNPEKYDLIVTDHSMPGLTGTQLAQIVRASGSQIPIILSSGRLGVKSKDALSKSGITEFIQKPWNTSELKEKIESTLATRSISKV